MDFCDIAEIEKEVEETTEIRRGINVTLRKIERALRGNTVENRAPNMQSTPRQVETERVSEQERSFTSNASSVSQVRLPKITLPQFNGDIKRYQAFRQCFKSSVDENESLSDIHKPNYLISSLEGQAFKALEGLDIMAENYANAKKVLKDRFGKTQQIISAHMKELLSLQNCPNGTTGQLRAIYDSINVQIRGLE